MEPIRDRSRGKSTPTADQYGILKTVTGKGLVAGTLSILTLMAVIAILVLLLFHTIPEPNKDYFMMVLGAVIAWTTSGFHYFMGTSQGSKAETAQRALERSTENR